MSPKSNNTWITTALKDRSHVLYAKSIKPWRQLTSTYSYASKTTPREKKELMKRMPVSMEVNMNRRRLLMKKLRLRSLLLKK
jgi:hypothetical protein